MHPNMKRIEESQSDVTHVVGFVSEVKGKKKLETGKRLIFNSIQKNHLKIIRTAKNSEILYSTKFKPLADDNLSLRGSNDDFYL